MFGVHEEAPNFHRDVLVHTIAHTKPTDRPSEDEAKKIANLMLFPMAALPIGWPVGKFARDAAAGALGSVIRHVPTRTVVIAGLAFGPLSMFLVIWMTQAGYFSSYWSALLALAKSFM